MLVHMERSLSLVQAGLGLTVTEPWMEVGEPSLLSPSRMVDIVAPQDLITGSVLVSSHLSDIKHGVSFHLYSDDSDGVPPAFTKNESQF